MSEADAFYKEILLHPHEAHPRLVYADWLEERGDPRGEYIRLACQYEDMTLSKAMREEALPRMDKLIAAHFKEWVEQDLAYLPSEEREGFHTNWLTFTGGFLDILTIPAAERDIIREWHPAIMEIRFNHESLENLLSNRRENLRGGLEEGEPLPPLILHPAELKTLLRGGVDLTRTDRETRAVTGILLNYIFEVEKPERLELLKILADYYLIDDFLWKIPGMSSPLEMLARRTEMDGTDFCEEARLLVRESRVDLTRSSERYRGTLEILDQAERNQEACQKLLEAIESEARLWNKWPWKDGPRPIKERSGHSI